MEFGKRTRVTIKGGGNFPEPIRDRFKISKEGRMCFRMRYDGLIVMETTKLAVICSWPRLRLHKRWKSLAGVKKPPTIWRRLFTI